VVLSAEERGKLIEIYGAAAGFDAPRIQSLKQEVHLVAIQRALKAAGRFEFLRTMKGNPVLAPFIPNALSNAKAAIHYFPEYRFIGDMIEKYGES
jgi:hypothetical protein